MPHVRNGTTSVSYASCGDPPKPALTLVFGLSMSMLDWFELGYVDRLQEHFHVVAIEPRGHGASSAPDDPALYTLPSMSSDIRAVLDHLGIETATLWGYSLGAKILLSSAAADPQRVSGLVLGGFELHSEVDPSKDLVAETLARGPAAWRTLWQTMFEVPAAMGERLGQSNTPALRALRRAEVDWPTLTDAPSKLPVPCLLYAGEQCFFRAETSRMTALFPAGRYIERQGRNHFSLMLDAAWICDEVIASFSINRSPVSGTAPFNARAPRAASPGSSPARR